MKKGHYYMLALAFVLFSACKENGLIAPCKMIPDSGPCKAYIPKYYFDQGDQQCKQFIWGGCQGVVPFDSYLACQQTCGGTPDSLDRCELVPDSGPCKAYIPKYYFDQGDQQCKQFIWGGCQGVVPFDSYLSCQQSCGGTLDSLGRCEMIPDPGPCDAIFPRYYYDQISGACKEFIWGGCDGVVPFDSYLSCQQSCGGTLDSLGRCEMIPDPGPCDAIFPRYYYDQISGACKEFIWGGCDGVVPFETLQECEQLCD